VTELVAIVDRDGLRWASASCLDALGPVATELGEVNIGWLLHPDDVRIVRVAWRHALGGERMEGSFRLRGRAGDWRRLEATASPLGDGTVLVVARDGTGRADAERRSQLVDRQLAQAEKMEAIGQLAAGVAHDFNNVLLAVRGYAELINWEAAASPTIRGFADEITSVCERATGLTRQLLAFGRIQAMVPELLDLNG